MTNIDPREWQFRAVPANSFVATPVSPALPDDPDFLGIRIDAAARVTFAPGAPWRLVVTAALRAEDGRWGAPFPPAWVLFVAVDAATHEARAGKMRMRRRRASVLGPPIPGGIVGYFVNPDLVEALSLPAVEATYFVYATFGDLVSNVVRVTVTRADAADDAEEEASS